MAYCDANCDGYIDYVEFANFLNWKDIMPTGLPAGPGLFYILFSVSPGIELLLLFATGAIVSILCLMVL